MLFALQASTPPLPLVPLPASVQRDQGALRLGRPLTIVGGGKEGKTLAEGLEADGVPVGKGGAKVTLKHVDGLPAEGYRLKVAADGATIEATTDAGLFYGGQTLRQLIGKDEIPAVTIEDAPRFGWRGMLLDVSRHFRTVADVERIIDLNARQKMNVFHWHLTDDGGWRMETKAYPDLTTRGAWRSYPVKGKWDYAGIIFPAQRKGDEYGGFYSKSEIKAVVAYAAKRHVTVVPEIEMPGHEQAALQCYPWLGCDNIPAGRKPNAFCPGKETTFAFLQKVLDETMGLFPSKFIHVGGDEVDKGLWHGCPQCQARMKSEGLKDVDELQSYLIRRMDKYLASKGRRLLGWDEILEGGLAPGATVMSWRGIQGGIAAAKEGKDVVMSPTTHLYFDYSYDSIPTSLVYSYDPIPKELSTEEAKHVLGAQGNVWTEWLADQADIERMAYPRAAALAEATWTPLERKSWPDFSARLGLLMSSLDRLAIKYYVDAPNISPTLFLTDEDVKPNPPAPISGWRLMVDHGDGTAIPLAGGNDSIMVPPGTKLGLFYKRDSDGAVSPTTTVQTSTGMRRTDTEGLMPGLSLWSAAGNFSKVPASLGGRSAVVAGINVASKPADEKYALRFGGFIRLPETGAYAFTVRSDDGSVLKIGGVPLVDHDGAHAATGKTATVWAKAGVYPLDLGYFDAGGANSLSVTVTPPGGKEQPIPVSWLWH
jgi:hexosaminidase